MSAMPEAPVSQVPPKLAEALTERRPAEHWQLTKDSRFQSAVNWLNGLQKRDVEVVGEGYEVTIPRESFRTVSHRGHQERSAHRSVRPDRVQPEPAADNQPVPSPWTLVFPTVMFAGAGVSMIKGGIDLVRGSRAHDIKKTAQGFGEIMLSPMLACGGGAAITPTPEAAAPAPAETVSWEVPPLQEATALTTIQSEWPSFNTVTSQFQPVTATYQSAEMAMKDGSVATFGTEVSGIPTGDALGFGTATFSFSGAGSEYTTDSGVLVWQADGATRAYLLFPNYDPQGNLVNHLLQSRAADGALSFAGTMSIMNNGETVSASIERDGNTYTLYWPGNEAQPNPIPSDIPNDVFNAAYHAGSEQPDLFIPTSTAEVPPAPTVDPLAGAPERTTGTNAAGEWVHQEGESVYTWNSELEGFYNELGGGHLIDWVDTTDAGLITAYISDQVQGRERVSAIQHTQKTQANINDVDLTAYVDPTIFERMYGHKPSNAEINKFDPRVEGTIKVNFYIDSPDNMQTMQISPTKGSEVYITSWDDMDPATHPGVSEIMNDPYGLQYRAKLLGINSQGQLVGQIGLKGDISNLTPEQTQEVMLFFVSNVINRENQSTLNYNDHLGTMVSFALRNENPWFEIVIR